MPPYPPDSEASHADGRKQKRGCVVTFLVWLALIVGLFAIGKLSPVDRERWEWLTTIIWIGLIFVVPAIGIIQALALKSYLDWSSAGRGGKLFYRVLIFIGCWCFGLIALGVALISIISIFETEKTILWWQVVGVLVLTFLIGWVGVFLLWHPFSRNREKTETQEREDWVLYQQRLIHPEFANLEQQTSLLLPAAYRSLFEPESPWLTKCWTLYPRGLADDEEIYEWLQLMPAHPSSLRNYPGKSEPFLCFGEGDEECEFWLQVGPEDPPVWLHFPEAILSTHQTTQISERLSEFLAWPREES